MGRGGFGVMVMMALGVTGSGVGDWHGAGWGCRGVSIVVHGMTMM